MLSVMFIKSETKELKPFQKLSISDACDMTETLENHYQRTKCQQRFKFPQFQRNEIPHYERLNRCLGRINSCFFLFSQTVGVTLDVKCNRMM